MYPFMAIIALQSSNNASSRAMKMSVVDRVEGLTDVSTIIRRFDTMIQRYGGAINRLRMERDQRDMERRLREEQDRAYLESLKADQEKVHDGIGISFRIVNAHLECSFNRNDKHVKHVRKLHEQKKQPNLLNKNVWNKQRNDNNTFVTCAVPLLLNLIQAMMAK